MQPTAIDKTKSISISQKVSWGICTSITKASSPILLIMAAISAPKCTMPWVYIETMAKPPKQPGKVPSKVAMTICRNGFSAKALLQAPRVAMFRTSIKSMMISTKAVIIVLSRSTSLRICIILPLFYCFINHDAGRYRHVQRGDIALHGNLHQFIAKAQVFGSDTFVFGTHYNGQRPAVLGLGIWQ